MYHIMKANLEISGIDIEVLYHLEGGTDTGYQDAHHNPEEELDRPDPIILKCNPTFTELKKLGISENEVQEKLNEQYA